MKIDKKQLRQIINEEVQNFLEAGPSTGEVAAAARGGEMRKDISSASGAGRALIGRLQKMIQHIGASKVTPNASMMTKLGHLEAALGIQAEQPTGENQ